MCNAPPFLNGRRFGEDDPRPTHSKPAEVDEMPIVEMTLMCGVLAHWRNDHAVARLHAPQSEALKQHRNLGHRDLSE
jgi:hypothetical protein